MPAILSLLLLHFFVGQKVPKSPYLKIYSGSYNPEDCPVDKKKKKQTGFLIKTPYKQPMPTREAPQAVPPKRKERWRTQAERSGCCAAARSTSQAAQAVGARAPWVLGALTNPRLKYRFDVCPHTKIQTLNNKLLCLIPSAPGCTYYLGNPRLWDEGMLVPSQQSQYSHAPHHLQALICFLPTPLISSFNFIS